MRSPLVASQQTSPGAEAQSEAQGGVTTGGGITGGVSGCGGSAGGFINSPGNDAGGTSILEEREGNDKIEGSDAAGSGIPEEMGCVKLSLMMIVG